jgi:tRNA modification GTPase
MDHADLHATRSTQHLTDTVAAIATPVGSGGIGVIRISGPEAFAVASKLFRGRNVTDFASHTAHHGEITNPETSEPIDDVVLTVFRAPRSYTGEDVVEISCHGGHITLRRALSAVYRAGAAPAGPGEFTKRAFLNGKIDLAQAEAVNDLIRARTEQAGKLALRQLEGELSRKVSEIATGVLSILARIEAAIDFPDDVEDPDLEAVAYEVEALCARIEGLIASGEQGRVYREGISLAIVGRPNVGKSSLLNALLRETRAIVTAVPGTTRDTIEETINIRGIPVIATDTAGLRETSDEVERIGVELSERAMAAAEIVLVVLDASVGVTDEDREILTRAGKPAVVIANKIDLAPTFTHTGAIPTSTKTGEGMAALEDKIAEAALRGQTAEAVFATNARHRQALISARESLTHVLEGISELVPIDLLPIDLLAARAALGEITGETASEDIVDRIFQDFCIGK